MDVGEPEPAFLIEAARRAVARSSIRDVAIQAGMSHGGLHNLIAGNTRIIYGVTLRRLRTWYLREWADGADGLTVGAASYLIQQLLAVVDADERRSAGLELLDALERIYRAFGTPLPAWFVSVRNEFRH